MDEFSFGLSLIRCPYWTDLLFLDDEDRNMDLWVCGRISLSFILCIAIIRSLYHRPAARFVPTAYIKGSSKNTIKCMKSGIKFVFLKSTWNGKFQMRMHKPQQTVDQKWSKLGNLSTPLDNNGLLKKKKVSVEQFNCFLLVFIVQGVPRQEKHKESTYFLK